MRAPAFAITGVLILDLRHRSQPHALSDGERRPAAAACIKNPETLARFRRQAPTAERRPCRTRSRRRSRKIGTVLSAVFVKAFAAVAWGKELADIPALFVSPNWFSELGATPSAGRLFGEGIDTATSEPVAVVSHQFWRTQLGADPERGRPNGRRQSQARHGDWRARARNSPGTDLNQPQHLAGHQPARIPVSRQCTSARLGFRRRGHVRPLQGGNVAGGGA